MAKSRLIGEYPVNRYKTDDRRQTRKDQSA